MRTSRSGPESNRTAAEGSAAADKAWHQAWKVHAEGVLVVRPKRALIRSRSSLAALRLKVSTRMRSGGTPRRTRSTTASTIVVVLPVPGPASTSSGPPAWSTTACCASSSTGAATGGSGVRSSR